MLGEMARKIIKWNGAMINKLIWWNGEIVNELNGEMVNSPQWGYDKMSKWNCPQMENLSLAWPALLVMTERHQGMELFSVLDSGSSSLTQC